MSVDRAVWVRQAREVLAQTHPGARGDLVIVLECGRHRERIECPDETVLEDGRPAPALSSLERDILRVVSAAPDWITAKAIATRLRVLCTAGFRAILRNLTEREPPLLEASKHGYRVVRD
jgi:hypothetical protein